MRNKLFTIIGSLALSAGQHAYAQAMQNFTILQFGFETVAAEDISDNGTVVGRVGADGFILRNGEFTRYVAEPVRNIPFAFSQIYGVNNAGDFVGEYFAQGVPPAGYVNRNGALTTIAAPDPLALRTIPQDINNQQSIAGFYRIQGDKTVGFLMKRGQFQKIEIPGAQYVTILGMNDRDQLVGHYTLQGEDLRRGFLWAAGQVTPIEVPGADQTEPTGIGEDGTIVGHSLKVINGFRRITGFVLRDGQYETIGIPGQNENFATGINRKGQISGSFFTVERNVNGGHIQSTGAGWVLNP